MPACNEYTKFYPIFQLKEYTKPSWNLIQMKFNSSETDYKEIGQ